MYVVLCTHTETKFVVHLEDIIIPEELCEGITRGF